MIGRLVRSNAVHDAKCKLLNELCKILGRCKTCVQYLWTIHSLTDLSHFLAFTKIQCVQKRCKKNIYFTEEMVSQSNCTNMKVPSPVKLQCWHHQLPCIHKRNFCHLNFFDMKICNFLLIGILYATPEEIFHWLFWSGDLEGHTRNLPVSINLFEMC
jgi:hypothetical protein